MKLSLLITKMRTDRPDEWLMDELSRKATELEKQRDELLVALEKIHFSMLQASVLGNDKTREIKLSLGICSLAIESVKGGAA